MSEIAFPTATLASVIDSWLAGVDDETAANALIAVGARPDLLAEATQVPHPPGPGIVEWSLTVEELRQRIVMSPEAIAAGLIVPPSPVWRLAVRGADVDPPAVVERLLASPAVASAFAAVERPPGSLRRRPWRWPLRVALAGFTEDAADELTQRFESGHEFLPRLVDIARVEDEPAAVDVLLVPGPLASALGLLHEHQPVANAVLVLGELLERWPVVAGELATARALTAAVAAGLVHADDLLRPLEKLVVELSHAQPFDVAVTEAFHRRLLLTAEPEGMARSALPETARRLARAVRAAVEAAPEPLPEAAAAAAEIDAIADGMFGGERHEATILLGPAEAADARLDQVEQERWLQARVNVPPDAAPGAFHSGRNDVAVFIGPEEEGAAAAPVPFDDSQLPWEDVDAFRLTVAFVPLVPEGPPQQEEMELPRFGRTPHDARFRIDVPVGVEEVVARLVVLFRNRVLQTAVLRGKVGERVELADATAVHPSLSNLDDRRPFDVALLANRAEGVDALIRHSSGHTFVGSKRAVEESATRLSTILGEAVSLGTRSTLKSERARKILVDLANEGHDLRRTLELAIGDLSSAKRLQLVTASSDWLLPVELLYDRFAPDDDAKVCARFLDGAVACGADCAPSEDRSIVCPNAFWCMTKTIERHHFDPMLESELNQRVLVLVSPRRRNDTLSIERALFGASRRVGEADRRMTLDALGGNAHAATSWAAWSGAIADADVHLLVLLPHSGYPHRSQPFLEIDDDELKRARIEAVHVARTKGVAPVVLLFGCETAGTPDDPAGFASRFCMSGASIVFHSSAELLATHAAALAQRLAALLTAGGRARPVSDVLTEFRAAAVRDGLLAAFAIYAYGDADWRI